MGSMQAFKILLIMSYTNSILSAGHQGCLRPNYNVFSQCPYENLKDYHIPVNLMYFIIRESNLTTLEPYGLLGHYRLGMITIENCRVGVIQEHSFAGLKHLHALVL